MDLLTFVGQASKRRETYIDRARRLAEDHQSLEALEKEMESRAEALTRRLRKDKITFSEFQRASAEDTLSSSLAAFMIGRGNTRVSEILFAESMGQMKFLWNFFDDLKLSFDSGRLTDGDEFAEDDEDGDWYFPVPGEDAPLEISPQQRNLTAPVVSSPTSLVVPGIGAEAARAAVRAVKTSEGDIESQGRGVEVSATADTEVQVSQAQSGVRPSQRQRGPATWNGLMSRLKRFLVTPLYRWFKTGEFEGKQTGGFKEMRRITRGDKRVCQDCRYYATLGWVPIGSLPMPGVSCRCHDRCRCRIEYR